MKRFLTFLVAGVVGAGVLVVGGIALAAGGGDGSTIDACYNDRSGALRVDTGAGCGRNETAVTLGTGLTTRIVTAEDQLPNPGFKGATATCGKGEVVLGGGLEIESINSSHGVTTSAPITFGDGTQGWQVSMHSDVSGDPTTFRAYAVCAFGAPG